VSSAPCPPSRGEATGPLGEVIVETARLALFNAKTNRQHTGAVLRTYLLPKGALNAALEAKHLPELVAQTQGPHVAEAFIQCWSALLAATAACAEVSAENKTAVSEHASQFPTAQSMFEVVRFCTVARTHAGDFLKIQFAIDPVALTAARAVCTALITLGATMQCGPPPRSPPECAVIRALAAAGFKNAFTI